MVDFFVALRKVIAFALARARNRLGRVVGDLRQLIASDSELEQLAQQVFAEIKHTPLVQPGRDLGEAVRQRLRRFDTGDGPDAPDNRPRPHA